MFTSVMALAILAFVFQFNSASEDQLVSTQTVSVLHAIYPADFSDDRVLMGAVHNAFVGKALEEVGTKERGMGPETQFEVEVIDNIKGDLNGTVTVNQQGGYKDGVLYVMEGDVFTAGSDEESLLQVGSTYLFATRYSEENDWYTVMSYPSANKVLSSDKNRDDFSGLIAEDARIKDLRAAYAHEILLKADVKNNKTYNAFVDLKKEQVERGEESYGENSVEEASDSVSDETVEQPENASSTEDLEQINDAVPTDLSASTSNGIW